MSFRKLQFFTGTIRRRDRIDCLNERKKIAQRPRQAAQTLHPPFVRLDCDIALGFNFVFQRFHNYRGRRT